MKITVRRAAPDVYSLLFDGDEVVLDGAGLRTLLVEVTRVLTAGAAVAAGRPSANAEDLMRTLRHANNVGIQALMRAAARDDLLVLLKAAQGNPDLSRRLLGNLSPRARTLCAEDMAFAFRDGLPAERARQAFARLAEIAGRLEDEGTLVYDNVKQRHDPRFG